MGFTRVLAGLDITQPFLGPWELERRRGRPFKARLGANECLFGVSPAALRVLSSRGAEIALYSDPVNKALRDSIAGACGLSRDCVVIAEGIEGLLGLFARAFIDPGDVAVNSRGGYPSFDYYVRGCGGRLVHQPYLQSGHNDIDGLLDAARRHDAKLLYLANPDNPTGTLAGPTEIKRLLDGLPAGCVLLLDEAYVEFADPSAVLPTNETRSNLIRLRTFSKAYGLAGARVGYALAEPGLLAQVERIRHHFGVSKLSQEMAHAAFEDRDFLGRVVAETAKGIEDYKALAARLGVTTLPGSGNFVAFDFGDARTAKAVATRLDAHDILVRHVVEPPLDRLIRITVGPQEARAYLTEILLKA
ncbi:aminotransferase class I/II-fold pyridoxal phosphate-dependent enzyme [Corallococcus llansteffanensis]|uniref:Aminotransferase class I/II-fold pyridoxal phosphate-dependent enzyme n=1 Tax=Corallococcus llansteffanensis TaxID=2316731 RepID=A0A3A8QJ97_9BACT|nr:aminotransferase class I/II-fold pyridoxal phosphate-dependent enzyme [Corallococcus llansteffanensis]RKH68637.1 aminotransferase class I/II-fold pyridoxal phosphate-dependent enzyme [Corallococcus llansteffanensis]